MIAKADEYADAWIEAVEGSDGSRKVAVVKAFVLNRLLDWLICHPSNSLPGQVMIECAQLESRDICRPP